MSNKTKITRRQFLLLTGGTVGATVLACGGLAVLGTREPEIKFIRESYESDPKMKNKILVAYASKCGSTGEVAQVIGQTLANSGNMVDVRPISDVGDLSPYQAIVLGSAIRVAKWLPEASAFVETNRQALGRIPTAYFTVCMTLSKDNEESRRKAAAFLDPVRQIAKPVEEGFFAGKMDYGKLSFIDHLLITKVKPIPEGDFRNWQAIQTWAQALPARLALNS
jgi:menaquinone-dependent protoporphyrinogen oxidase